MVVDRTINKKITINVLSLSRLLSLSLRGDLGLSKFSTD
jgi:hypothetical protein